MFRIIELCRLRRRLLSSPKATRKARPYCRATRLMLEGLESRIVPATQTFNPGDVPSLIKDLQGAYNAPNDTTVINLQPNTTYTLTAVNNYWYGPTGLPPIRSNVVIHGNGATIARDANPNDNTPIFRLFYVSGGMELSPGELSMDNVTLEGGVAKGGASSAGGGGLGAGGAIFNQGTLNLTAVTLTDNEALGGSSGVGRQGGAAAVWAAMCRRAATEAVSGARSTMDRMAARADPAIRPTREV